MLTISLQSVDLESLKAVVLYNAYLSLEREIKIKLSRKYDMGS